MRRTDYLRLTVISFSILETILGIDYAIVRVAPAQVAHGFKPPPIPNNYLQHVFGIMWSGSIPLAVTGWFTVGLITWWRKGLPPRWREAGIDNDLFNLMVKMRGAFPRLAILQHLDHPRHRSELSELTGIDWKDVDRYLNSLQKYGLVSITAESGSIKMYALTGQGKLILKLVSELDNNPKGNDKAAVDER